MYYEDESLFCQKHGQIVETVLFSKNLQFSEAIQCEACLKLKGETMEISYNLNSAKSHFLQVLQEEYQAIIDRRNYSLNQAIAFKNLLIESWADFNKKINSLKASLEEWEKQLNEIGKDFQKKIYFQKDLEEYFSRKFQPKYTDKKVNDINISSLEKLKHQFIQLINPQFLRQCFEKLIELRNQQDGWERIMLFKKLEPKLVDQPISQFPQKQVACALQFQNNLLIASCQNDIKIYSFDNGNLKDEGQILQGHTKQVQGIVVSKKFDWFASCSSDKFIRTWKKIDNTIKWQSVTAQEKHSDEIYGLILNDAEDYLISYGGDSQILIWQVNCQHNIIKFQYALLNENKNKVLSLSLNPSENYLIGSHGDNKISLWKKCQIEKTWKFFGQQQAQQMGFRICFIGNHQFIFQGKNGGMSIYQISDNSIFKIREIKLDIKENEDMMLFPVIFVQAKQLIILKHNKTVYIMKRTMNGEILQTHKIVCQTKLNYGTLTNDDKFLVIWQEEKQKGNQFKVHKIIYN